MIPGQRRVISESPLHVLMLEYRGAETWRIDRLTRADMGATWRADSVVLEKRMLRRISRLVLGRS